MRHYGSFLVRWWHKEQQQRLNIRHIQSGEELTVKALDEALAWMVARVDDANRASPRSPPPDPDEQDRSRTIGKE